MVEGEGVTETAVCCNTEIFPPTTTHASAESSPFLPALTRRSPGTQRNAEHTGLPPRNVAIDRIVPQATSGTTTDVTVTVYFEGGQRYIP
jgi:hypothetical protein